MQAQVDALQQRTEQLQAQQSQIEEQALGVQEALSAQQAAVDTLSQTFSGEENSAAEMSTYLRELGLWFRESWRCAVLVIHHSGHVATDRPRGSSAIRANRRSSMAW